MNRISNIKEAAAHRNRAPCRLVTSYMGEVRCIRLIIVCPQIIGQVNHGVDSIVKRKTRRPASADRTVIFDIDNDGLRGHDKNNVGFQIGARKFCSVTE